MNAGAETCFWQRQEHECKTELYSDRNFSFTFLRLPFLYLLFKRWKKNTNLLEDKNSHRKVGSNWYWRHLTLQSCVLTEGLGTSQFSFLTSIRPVCSSAPPEVSRTLPFYIITKLQSEFLFPTWNQCVTVLSQVWKQNNLCTKLVANHNTVILCIFFIVKHNHFFQLLFYAF